MRKNVLGRSSLEAYESQNDQNSYFGPVSNEIHCVAGSTPATSCQWLLTLQQCGSFVGKRLLGEVLFTAFNEDAASTATNQRSSQFLSVTQRLHQTTKTADRAHGTNRVTNRDPFLLPDMSDKGLVQVSPSFKKPSQDPAGFLCPKSRAACPF